MIFKPSKGGLKGDRRSKIRFRTKTHEDLQETAEVDPAEAMRPIKVATELKSLSGAQRFTLGNGMRVVLLPLNAWPVISGQLIFNVGAASTPDNPYLAQAAASFLQPPFQGEAQARTGVAMGCFATPDHTICSVRGMSIYLDVVVKGLERLISAGEYSQEEIESWQKRNRLAYKHKRTQVEMEYERQQLAAIFGPDHPYTRTAIDSLDAIGRLGRDSLSDFRNKHYSSQNATLVLVGNFDPKAAESLVRDNFGSWGKGRKDTPVSREPFKRTGPAFIGVIGEEDPQVNVTIMYPSPPGIDGQEAARKVLTEMVNAWRKHRLPTAIRRTTFGVRRRCSSPRACKLRVVGGADGCASSAAPGSLSRRAHSSSVGALRSAGLRECRIHATHDVESNRRVGAPEMALARSRSPVQPAEIHAKRV